MLHKVLVLKRPLFLIVTQIAGCTTSLEEALMTVTGGFLSVDFVFKKQKTSSIDGSVDSSDDEKRS